ncbi:MAG TPA: helix-turn-helix transcriptional regulator [Gammaproteobacteria bacterium]
MSKSSRNVFTDLGFEAEEATNLRLRADFMIALQEYIRREGLTQAQAAKTLHVTQPKISRLMSSDLTTFSLDKLVELLGRVGSVRINVSRSESARKGRKPKINIDCRI